MALPYLNVVAGARLGSVPLEFGGFLVELGPSIVELDDKRSPLYFLPVGDVDRDK